MTRYLSNKIKIVSFLSIIMVVFLHAYNLDTKQNGTVISFGKSYNWMIQNFISNGLTRIAVPLFFLLSGYLFFRNAAGSLAEFAAKIRKRVKTLLIPFLFWSLAGIFLYFVLQSVPQTAVFFTKERVVDYSLQKWLMTVFISPIPYQFWFIRDLFILVLLSPLLFYGLKHFAELLIAAIFIMWFCVVGDFFNSVEAALFFITGGYLATRRPDIPEIRFERKAKFLLLLWLILVAAKVAAEYYGLNELATRAVYRLSVLCGVAAFWGAADSIITRLSEPRKNAVLKYCGFTFFIYALHEPLLTIVKKVLFVVLGKAETNYFQIYFIAPAMTIFACFIAAMLLKRYARVFYEWITGGR